MTTGNDASTTGENTMKQLYEASIRKIQQVTKTSSILRERIAFLLEDIEARKSLQENLESALKEVQQKRSSFNEERTISTARISSLEMEVQKLTKSLRGEKKASSRYRSKPRDQSVQTEFPISNTHDSEPGRPHLETWTNIEPTESLTDSKCQSYTSGWCNETTQTESCISDTRCQLCEKWKSMDLPCLPTDDRRKLLMSLQCQIIHLEEAVIDLHARLIDAETSKSALVEEMKQGVGSLQMTCFGTATPSSYT